MWRLRVGNCSKRGGHLGARRPPGAALTEVSSRSCPPTEGPTAISAGPPRKLPSALPPPLPPPSMASHLLFLTRDQGGLGRSGNSLSDRPSHSLPIAQPGHSPGHSQTPDLSVGVAAASVHLPGASGPPSPQHRPPALRGPWVPKHSPWEGSGLLGNPSAPSAVASSQGRAARPGQQSPRWLAKAPGSCPFKATAFLQPLWAVDARAFYNKMPGAGCPPWPRRLHSRGAGRVPLPGEGEGRTRMPCAKPPCARARQPPTAAPGTATG